MLNCGQIRLDEDKLAVNHIFDQTCSKKKLTGYVKVEDLKKMERIKQDLFDDLGPIKKNQFYFVGELGEDSELKYFSARQRKQFEVMKVKTAIEMGSVNKEYLPQKRMKSILQKEKDALMDTDIEPLSYSIIEH